MKSSQLILLAETTALDDVTAGVPDPPLALLKLKSQSC